MIKSDPNNPKGIVWIASYPKSGNTWVRLFLYHLARIGAGLPADGQDLPKLRQSSLSEVVLIPLFERIIGKPKAEFTLEDVNKARPYVQATLASEREGIALMKTHNARVNLAGIPAINTSVSLGAIYIIRNPLDVAVSLKDFIAGSQDQAIAVLGTEDFTSNPHGVFEIWGSWSQNVASWTARADPQILLLRYEDIIDNPVKAFAMVTRHMQLKATPPQIVEAVEHSSFARMQQKEAATGFREKLLASQKFFREGRAGQWREQLSKDQIRQIVGAHHVQMKRHGYLTEELMEFVPAEARA